MYIDRWVLGWEEDCWWNGLLVGYVDKRTNNKQHNISKLLEYSCVNAPFSIPDRHTRDPPHFQGRSACAKSIMEFATGDSLMTEATQTNCLPFLMLSAAVTLTSCPQVATWSQSLSEVAVMDALRFRIVDLQKRASFFDVAFFRAVLRILGALGTNHNLKRNLIFVSISQSQSRPTVLHMHVCHIGKCIHIEINCININR